jgi:hypothetical protein
MRAQSAQVAAAIVATALSAAGCGPIGWVRVTVNQPLDPREVAFIAPGRTTWTEVANRLGAPNRLAASGAGLVADYLYSDSRSFTVNPGWPLGFFGPVSSAPHSLTLGSQGIGDHTFQVAIDSRGVVQYADFRRGDAAAQYRLLPFEGPGQ